MQQASPTGRSRPHHAHWPPGLPLQLPLQQDNVFDGLAHAARRWPRKASLVFCNTPLSYADLLKQVERLAGYLQQSAGVAPGDRVLLCMQNSPQWVIAFYAVLRVGAVVVPVNPMHRNAELLHCVQDSAARLAIVSQELLDGFLPLAEDGRLSHLIVARYEDMVDAAQLQRLPLGLRRTAHCLVPTAEVVDWQQALAAGRIATAVRVGPDTPCVMPYTSGTTGAPRGCLHTHGSVMSAALASACWFETDADSIALSALPLFHVTGMTGGMSSLLQAGATAVLLPRWDRDAALECIEQQRITHWQSIATMLIDFLAHPRIEDADLSSLRCLRGGGAAMPEAVAERLARLTGLEYIEGYGLSETMAATHINPPGRVKRRSLGIPIFGVDARVIDPVSLCEVPPGGVGEIVLRAPQLMSSYWNAPQLDPTAFVHLDEGARFFRTGDLARIDAEGYFFMVDRLKRMINSSGFKVSPAEVEALLYRHPAVHEACVVSTPDARRGEAVKALVVLREGVQAKAEDILGWARDHMAVYKAPRQIAFVTALPKSATGKILWRRLQEQEWALPAER